MRHSSFLFPHKSCRYKEAERSFLQPLHLSIKSTISQQTKPPTLSLPPSPTVIVDMAIGGVLLRGGQTFLRFLQLCCAGIILGIFSWYLASLTHNSQSISVRNQAVEGIAGAGCLYAIFGVLCTFFLGGVRVFGYLAVLLDILFAGAFAAVAYFTRGGATSCKGFVNTPLGNGDSSTQSTGGGHNLGKVCRLNTACFACAIIAIFLFLVTAVMQLLLVRHHKKEKAFGPSPSNNYTKGSGKTPFWKRGRKAKTHNTHDAEMATVGAIPSTHATHDSHKHHNTHPTDLRPSHETGMTGSTVNGNGYTEPKYGQPGYGQTSNNTYDEVPGRHETYDSVGGPTYAHNVTTKPTGAQIHY